MPGPKPRDVPRRRFVRGKTRPRSVEWFGLRSFWGHVWRFAAIGIVTDDIDFRDWMQADSAGALTARMADALAGNPNAPTLTEAIDDDLIIDYVADTGDDVSVSHAVAKMLFASYEVDDPLDSKHKLILPRGRLLIFGGDTAYPVATDLEIETRVIQPYNRVLENLDDGPSRCLLGVPGNHDWYGGIDGFGRLFHERRCTVARDEPPRTDRSPQTQLGHFVQWVEALTAEGGRVFKRRVLRLQGYTPTQRTSYWAMHLAPSLDAWGVDRQLSHVDFQQRHFFSKQAKDRGLFLLLPEPVYAYLDRHPPGIDMMNALDRSVGRDGVFVLTGDSHQYSRLDFEPGLQVTAGGGGAFLHPARIARNPGPRNIKAEFPGPKASRSLAYGIPFALLSGRAGTALHFILAAVYAGAYPIDRGEVFNVWGPLLGFLVGLGAAVGTVSLERAKRPKIGFFCVLTAAVIAALPPLAHLVCAPLGATGSPWLDRGIDGALLAGELVLAVLVAGLFLMTVVLKGITHDPFGALSHPGYKHFVRLRVRRDGTAIDAWVLGREDPLGPEKGVALIDHFTWKNPRPREEVGPVAGPEAPC